MREAIGRSPPAPVAAVLLSVVLASTAAAQQLLVSSDFNHEVLRYHPTTGAYESTFIPAALPDGLNQPHGMLVRCNDILLASFGSDQILRYHRSSGAFLGVFIDAASGLNDPVYLAYGPDGRIYISSQASDEILRFSRSGAFIDAFIPAGSGGLDGPSGFAFGSDGRLYVAGRYSANVIAYDAQTGAYEETVLDSSDNLGFGSTFGLNFGDNGDLYVASNNQVIRYDLDSGIVASIPIGFPIGIEPGPAGNIYVASSNNLYVINSATNALSGPFLTGGTINLLNFFTFTPPDGQPACASPDFDLDGDVDADDFDAFQACAVGPAIPLAPACAAFDLDGDLDADLNDFGQLQRCRTAPDLPADPSCVDEPRPAAAAAPCGGRPRDRRTTPPQSR